MKNESINQQFDFKDMMNIQIEDNETHYILSWLFKQINHTDLGRVNFIKDYYIKKFVCIMNSFLL